MQQDLVLVRAAGGEPCQLVAMSTGPAVVYVANPASLRRVAAGESWPVGVPKEDVFHFDERIFDQLSVQWARSRHLERADWNAFSLIHYAT